MRHELVNETSIKECLEYVDEQQREEFKEVMKTTSVKLSEPEYRPYFSEDKEYRNVYTVYMKRGDKQMSFKFGDSIMSTNEGRHPTLYSILTSIGADFSLNEYGFGEFCQELGYDEDSRKAEKTFKALEKQNKKLNELFEESEIYTFPA